MPLVDRLNKLLEGLRKALSDISRQVAGESWGYGHCVTEEDKEIMELESVLHSLRNQELSTGICICDEEMKIIESNVHRLLGPDCGTGQLSFSRGEATSKSQWALQNPGCVSYETWADYLYAQCQKVGIDFKVYIKKCESLDIDIKAVNKELCKIVDLALEVEEKKCDLDINLDINVQKCEVEFNTVITPIGCDIDFKTYVHAIQCGLTVDLVSSLLKCGATISVNADDIDVCYPEVPVVPCTLQVMTTEQLTPEATFNWNSPAWPTGATAPFYLKDISCPPNLPDEQYGGLERVTVLSSCGCVLEEDPDVSLDQFSGSLFFDDTPVPAVCNGVSGFFTFTVLYATPITAPYAPPSYQSMDFDDITFSVQDPLGNTAIGTLRVWTDGLC